MIFLFSSCLDEEESAETEVGGLLTFNLLRLLKNPRVYTMYELYTSINNSFKMQKFPQTFVISSSHKINKDTKFEFPITGKKRALLIGINYTGTEEELYNCHVDVHNTNKYLTESNFSNENIVVLLDKENYKQPTKENILGELRKIIYYSTVGDFIYIHVSAHGRFKKDVSNDEIDNNDETLLPSDWKINGEILDDELNKIIMRLISGITAICVFDTCHSGTVLDLPFILR